MFNLKRLVLLTVFAAFAYFFWPRQPDLLGYVPTEIAALQAKAIQQTRSKQWFAHTVSWWQIYYWQYQFSPVTSLSLAIEQGRADAIFRDGTDEYDRSKAEEPLKLFYEKIQAKTAAKFDPSAVAQKEIQTWNLAADETTGPDLIQAKAEQLALLYGGPPKKYLPAAQHFATVLRTPTSPDLPKTLRLAWTELQKAARSH
jgi:hypothetical protein